MILVVSAVIRDPQRPGKVAVAQRRSTHYPEIDEKWEFPGGKVKVWESPEGALVREIKEEAGLIIQPTELLNAVVNRYSFGDCVVLYYLCNKIGGDIKLSEEISRFEWMGLHEILGLDSLDGTVSTAAQLITEESAR